MDNLERLVRHVLFGDRYLSAYIWGFNHDKNGDIAAKIGYLDAFLYYANLSVTNSAMDLAAKNGHLDVVMWLHENRQEGCTDWAMSWAAQNGHQNIAKWLHDNT